MRFFSIVPADDNSEAGIMPDPSLFIEMEKLAEEGYRNGTLLAQDGVKPSSEGARVKFTKGDVVVIDGPFAESKELIADAGQLADLGQRDLVVGPFAQQVDGRLDDAVERLPAAALLGRPGVGGCALHGCRRRGQ